MSPSGASTAWSGWICDERGGGVLVWWFASYVQAPIARSVRKRLAAICRFAATCRKYALPPNRQTGMPRTVALSARFSVMPDPWTRMLPDWHRQEKLVVALEGRSLSVAGLVRLEGDVGDLAGIDPARGDELGAHWRSAVQEHHVGMFCVDLVEDIPDPLVVVASDASGEGVPLVPPASAVRFRQGALRRENPGCQSMPQLGRVD